MSHRKWLAGNPGIFTFQRICISIEKKIFRVFKYKKYWKELYKIIFMNPSPKIFSLKRSKLLKHYVLQPLTSDQQLWKGSYASMLLILCMPSKPPMTYTLPPNTAILCLQRPILRYSICIHLLMEALYFQTSCFVSLPPGVHMTRVNMIAQLVFTSKLQYV